MEDKWMIFELKKTKAGDPLQTKDQLGKLFSSQPLAALSTYGNSQPYCNLVAFTSSDDLKYLVFATSRETTKYMNIQGYPQVSMLIDNRSNQVSDFHDAQAVTVIGRVKEATGQKREELLGMYFAKHPNLRDFALSPTSALIAVEVERYLIASHFQSVMVLMMKQRSPDQSCRGEIAHLQEGK
jgi:heme iron utilization protein